MFEYNKIKLGEMHSRCLAMNHGMRTRQKGKSCLKAPYHHCFLECNSVWQRTGFIKTMMCCGSVWGTSNSMVINENRDTQKEVTTIKLFF